MGRPLPAIAVILPAIVLLGALALILGAAPRRDGEASANRPGLSWLTAS